MKKMYYLSSPLDANVPDYERQKLAFYEFSLHSKLLEQNSNLHNLFVLNLN
jgi:hypothetical protein